MSSIPVFQVDVDLLEMIVSICVRYFVFMGQEISKQGECAMFVFKGSLNAP